MFCPECGTKIDEPMNFCPECGTNLIGLFAEMEAEEAANKPQQTVSTPAAQPAAPTQSAQPNRIENVHADLQAAGIEVLYDDRDERPGSKFKDADLIGIPLRITVGDRGLKNGEVELLERRGGVKTMLPVADAASRVAEMVREALR